MVKIKNPILQTPLFTSILIILLAAPVFSEELTLTTYYPAPYGAYRQLATMTAGVGDNDGSGGINGNDAPDAAVAAQQGDIWVAGNVGIGTTTPQNRLDVGGAAVIGAGYAGVSSAPLNGLLVQGNVGIGTANAQANLEVRDTLRLIPSGQPAGSPPVQRHLRPHRVSLARVLRRTWDRPEHLLRRVRCGPDALSWREHGRGHQLRRVREHGPEGAVRGNS